MEFFENMGGWPGILAAVNSVILLAAAIVKATPTKEDDKVLAQILSFVNVLGLGLGNEKPKESKESDV